MSRRIFRAIAASLEALREGRITRRSIGVIWRQMNGAADFALRRNVSGKRCGILPRSRCAYLGHSEPLMSLRLQNLRRRRIPCEAIMIRGSRSDSVSEINDGNAGYFQPRSAGYISPRRLVRAQTIAAERAGAGSRRTCPGDFGRRLGCDDPDQIGQFEAERVLVAAGGHTQSLLGQSLGFTVYRVPCDVSAGAAEVNAWPECVVLCLGPRARILYFAANPLIRTATPG